MSLNLTEKVTHLVENPTEIIPVEGTTRTGTEGYSFYGVTKLINQLLRQRDLPEVTPQYIRSLAMSGKVDGVRYEKGLKGIRFSEEDTETFVVNFVARRVSNK